MIIYTGNFKPCPMCSALKAFAAFAKVKLNKKNICEHCNGTKKQREVIILTKRISDMTGPEYLELQLRDEYQREHDAIYRDNLE